MSHQGAASQNGPLTGLRVLEFVGLGPGPHCAMLLADLGAEVVRFERPGGNGFPNAVTDRGRHVVTVDLKNESDRALCFAATTKADVLIEGYRPGVMERLGLGPTDLLGVRRCVGAVLSRVYLPYVSVLLLINYNFNPASRAASARALTRP